MWRPATRILFRWWFVFSAVLALQIIEVALGGTLKPLHVLYVPYWAVTRWVVDFLSGHILGFVPSGTLEGSDSDAAWLKLLWSGALSLVAAAIWTAVAKAVEYRKLFDFNRTFVRHSLAAVMLWYGYGKVFTKQFFAPSATDLVQTFGGSTPFGLVWRFMGYSQPYQVFGGLLECVGALLLLWRRTTTAGALLLAAVLSNIVMLNFCYAIPVKNFSLTLLGFALFLLLPDARRLLHVLVVHRPVTPLPLRPFPMSAKRERARGIVKALWIALLVIGIGYHELTGGWPESPIQGLYDVESFRRAGVEVPIVAADHTVWQQLAFGNAFGPSAIVVMASGERVNYDPDIDLDKGTLELAADKDHKYHFKLRRPDATHLELDGELDGKPVVVRLRAHDLSALPLMSHEFQWIDDGGDWR